MKRDTWRTWILVGVVAMLGAGALAEQARSRRLAPKPIAAIDASQVREIERNCTAGCDRVLLLKRQGAWELNRPWVAPADAAKVAQLVAIAATPVRRAAPAGLEPAALGLDPPYATLRLGARTLEFGSTVPPQQDRYVRAGEVVSIVQDRFSAILTGPPESFVDPKPLAGLSVASGTVLGQPMTPETLARWRELAAVRIDRLPPTFPGHTLEFQLENGRTQVFQFDIREQELWLFRQGVRVLYVIDAQDRAALGFAH
jgi:hypothetical protein